MHHGEASPQTLVTPVVVTKSLVSAGILLAGFTAISDDDYARVVIAQSFAESPRLDPSGTSWLPLPFWAQGGVMLAFGRSLEVARISAFLLGILSALAIVLAARWSGLGRRAALLAALIGCLLPHAAWLGVATVPDGPTAALLLLAMTAAVAGQVPHLALGAAVLLGATLSRYEAWPVALGFGALAIRDAWRTRDWRPALWGTVALVGPLLWMAHGAVHHGNATFFFARVSQYRQALGGSAGSLWMRVVWYPLALLRYEPELVGLLLVSIVLAHRTGELARLARYRSPLIIGLGLLGFLILGDLSDGAPTHHRERTLLALWLLMAVVGAELLDASWTKLARRARALTVAALLAVVGLCAGIGRAWLAPQERFASRAEEVMLGTRARLETEREPGVLLVDTKDYGYFAVMAAFGRPEQAFPIDDHDPRRKAPVPAFDSLSTLRQRLEAKNARWLVASREHEHLALRVGSLVAETPGFLLLRVR